MLGVIMGAFGAHALKASLGEYGLEIWKTAVLYQFIHGLAMIGLASFCDAMGKRNSGIILGLFTLGILLFSGSLFVLGISENQTLRSIMGPLTPLGGICFIIAWIFVIWNVLKRAA
jgi:uncharacterized membrane protein YgdD (TMEM256/DUF423 family)